MRWMVGLFGLLCGAVVVWTVANYGYTTADDPAVRWNMAFLFGVIATAGLFGHAVSVRIWSISRVWSMLIGLACVGALLLNLSNSLGALANRSSKAVAEVTSKAAALKDDRAELQRLQERLDTLGKFEPTDAAAVAAAERAAKAATIAKERECGNGDPKQRGKFCRDREDAERAANEALSKATTAKAMTDRANKLETEMQPIRDRVHAAGPIAETNVQGNALAKLFRLPDSEAGFAAVLQNFLLAAIVEVIIVLCMVTFELLSPYRHARSAAALRPLESAPTQPLLGRRPIRPRLVSSQPAAFSVVDFGAASLEPAPGERLDAEVFFLAYEKAAESRRLRALPPEEFVEPFKRLCDEAEIRTSKRNRKLYLMDVRLAQTLQAVAD
jgi:hypothetical protein